MELISVVVPVYNAGPYLRQCLNSLAAQTYPHVEIILVDDGSFDGSGQVCREYAERDGRFQYVRLSANRGPSAARRLSPLWTLTTMWNLVCWKDCTAA